MGIPIGRRGFLGGASTLLIIASAALGRPQKAGITLTTEGAARGIVKDGVVAFKGLHYGANTSGANRFRPPQPPIPWQGTRDFREYGERAPQSSLPRNPDGPLASWSDNALLGEDCLRLNIWTPDTNRRAKRPVMVWLHGGGFSSGAGSTNVYAGHNLARNRDVVVVTINHRLNIFGHLSLGHLDPAYADSGNVGMLDIVAALKWIRANIASFGGDPSRVMIFGESGGGAKVCALLAMPSAQGLFHAAVCESGPMIWGVTSQDARAAAAAVLETLKIATGDLRRLHSMSMDEILAAFAGVGPEWLRAFSPVVGGSLPTHPFSIEAPVFSKTVPLIIGVTRDEATLLNPAPGNFTLSWDSLGPALAKGLNGNATPVVVGYRALYPDYTPSEIFFAAMTQHMMTRNAYHVADMRAASAAAATWMYSLEWRTPVQGGMWGAPHALEIPLVFDTVRDSPSLLPKNDDTRYLSRLCGDLWTSMAAHAEPLSNGVDWPRYTAFRRQTLMLDRPPYVANDPRGDERKLLRDVPLFNICGRGIARPS